MTRITLLLITVFLCHLSLIGCQPMWTEYETGPDGRPHKLGTYTSDERWRRHMNKEMDDEASGKPVFKYYKSWKQKWQSYYATLRKDDDPVIAKKSGYREYLYADQMIAYIKQQRRARDLPAVD